MRSPFDHEFKKKRGNVYLHQYDSYEHYKEVQIYHNKRKLDRVWADVATLQLVANRISKEFGTESKLFGLCHGSRNGFEQQFLASKLTAHVLGTDISDTASRFPNSVQWDFHDVKEEWVGACHFVYTNALDQSWKPQLALTSWLGQLRTGGLLFIEHTLEHGPGGASEMDPFGATPEHLSFLLCSWFGHTIAIEIVTGVKPDSKNSLVLFIIKKLS